MMRRSVLLASGKKVIDTSPKIAEYGKYCGRSGQEIAVNENWCYTEYYPLLINGSQYVCDNVTDTSHTYQYQQKADGTEWDFWYGPRRKIFLHNVIRFSIKIDNLDDAYAYSELSGQIFFAGKSTPYYGYTNINDMPT